ncbi:N-acetylmuramoyl-L-alanine amidase [Streptacidiphilus sp. N8-3]|uniref:N-acetylmuramoyl-L-alanine amidase n=1 Tax=Streptacidiphilus cavernicola TaxID=3342716 RepID=A0ABV6W4U0_9ACTN
MAGALALAGLVGGAVAEAATGTLPPVLRAAHAPSGRVPAAPPGTLQDEFTAAAAEFHVPVQVLLAVSYQETLWESHQGEPSATGNYNVMGLTSVAATDLAPPTAAQKTADLVAAGDLTVPSAALLSRFETVDTSAPALHTLDAAAALIQQPDAALRGDPRQSIRGGAALLASYQQAAGGGLPTDPGRWYPAVAAYSQGPDPAAEAQFADRVYATVAAGASRTTDDGQAVALAADPSVKPRIPAALSRAAVAAGGVSRSLAAAPVRSAPCEAGVATGLGSCSFVAAGAGNAAPANRPGDGAAIRYLVLGGTTGSAASAVSTYATPGAGVSAHFVVAATGAVTQQLRTRDVAELTGNDSVDAHAVGVQTESYPLRSGSWIDEQEYASTALLVRDVAAANGIPLDRDHVLGQDDVPYPTADGMTAAHAAPGPYWDWSHFLDLLGVAPDGNGLPVVGGTVTVAPRYTAADKPVLTGCGGACTGHPADFVYLRTAASSSAPLIGDPSLAAAGLPTSGTDGSDTSDKAVYGQTFVVAAVSADGAWTAIWFGGRKAWFYNPGGVNGYANGDPSQDLVSPKNGTAIPVYGRAFPEPGAYAAAGAGSAAAQQLVPLPYTIEPGQAYPSSGELTGDRYVGPKDVIGTTQYYAIRYNHRIAYVAAADVQTTKPAVPPSGAFVPVAAQRIMDTADGTGGVPAAPVPADGRLVLPLSGVPATGVTAVVLDLTVSSPAASGAVTVYPDGRKRPGLATVDYTAGVTASTPVTVPVVDGRLDFVNAPVPGIADGAGIELRADLTGYFTMSGGGGPFHTAGPVQVLDTTAAPVAASAARSDSVRGGRLLPGGSVTLLVAGRNGVPRNATAVILNVTAADAASYGSVTVRPYGSAVAAVPPAASTVSFAEGQAIARQITVPLVDGRVQFHSADRVGAVGGFTLFADLVGYYA